MTSGSLVTAFLHQGPAAFHMSADEAPRLTWLTIQGNLLSPSYLGPDHLITQAALPSLKEAATHSPAYKGQQYLLEGLKTKQVHLSHGVISSVLSGMLETSPHGNIRQAGLQHDSCTVSSGGFIGFGITCTFLNISTQGQLLPTGIDILGLPQKFSRALVALVLDPEEITGEKAYTKMGFPSQV